MADRGENSLTLEFETRDFARPYRKRANPKPPADQLRRDLNWITEQVSGINERTEAVGYAIRIVATAVDPNTDTEIITHNP